MKRIITLIFMVFLCCTIDVNAQESGELEYYLEKYQITNDVVTASDVEEIPFIIYSSIKNCENVAIKYSDEDFIEFTRDDVLHMFNKAFEFENGEWYRGNLKEYQFGAAISDKGNNGKTIYIFFQLTYRCTLSELNKSEQVLDEIALKMEENATFETMTEAEKARMVYNFVINMYDYDYEISDSSYYPYGAIYENQGKAVCQCYALTYSYLCNKFGIDTRMVFNEEVTHSFNISRIDNKWYFVDCTSADNTKDFDKWFLFSKPKGAKLVYDYYDFTKLDFSSIPYVLRKLINDIKDILRWSSSCNGNLCRLEVKM